MTEVRRFVGRQRDEVIAERDAARAAVERVRELHCECTTGNCACGGGPGWCHGCDSTWPCATIRALDGAPVVSSVPVSPVDRLDLAAIEERAAAATPGPWQEFYGSMFDGEQRYYVGQVGPTVSINDITGDGLPRADAEFIAHARSDVPALVAEVKRLRGIADGATVEIGGQVMTEVQYIAAQFPVLDRLHAIKAERQSVLDLIAHARSISPSPSMHVYVADLERALGIDAPVPHKLGSES